MGRYMESLRKNLSAYTLDDAPEDVRELYKDEFIQLYASSIKCFLICIKLGFISGRSSFAPRLNQIWRQVRSGESYNRAESSYTSSSSLYCRILRFVRKWHYKIFCVNGKYGIQNRVPYFLFYTFTK